MKSAIIDCVDCVYARPRPKKTGDKRPCPSAVREALSVEEK